jgi:DNA primase
LWCEPGKSALTFQEARDYLLRRGFPPTIWEHANIGAVPDGFYGGRIVVPIEADDPDRTWLGWVARDYTGQADRKYLYPKGMLRGSILYQHRVLHVVTDEPAILVEGVFDALPYPDHAVAGLGKPSKWHVEALAEAKRPIAVALDGDAWREAEALALRLQLRGCRAGFVHLPPKQDPCELARAHGPGWLIEQARQCVA